MGSGTGGSGGAACQSRPASQLSEGPGKSSAASAAWTGDGYAVAWVDDRDGNPEIYFARLDSTGRKLGPDLRVTNDPAESVSPSLVWAASELGLAWVDHRDGNSEIYFARLDAAGTKRGAEVRVTSDPARSEFPSLVFAHGGYAVAWNDTRDTTYQIYIARMDALGSKLGEDIRVSAGTALSASPSLAASNAGFGVAWHDTRDGAGLQIYFARLDASGARIGGELRVSTQPGGNASVASNGSTYAIAWGGPGTGSEVQWISVDAAGNAVGTPTALTASGNTAGAPSLIARPGGYALSWPDGRDGDREIYVSELDETGKLGREIRVSDDTTASLGQTLVRSSVGYGVAWVDDPTDTSGEIRFAGVCP